MAARATTKDSMQVALAACERANYEASEIDKALNESINRKRSSAALPKIEFEEEEHSIVEQVADVIAIARTQSR